MLFTYRKPTDALIFESYRLIP